MMTKIAKSETKIAFFREKNFRNKNSLKTNLHNDVRNVHAKFHRDRSIRKVLNLGGTICREKKKENPILDAKTAVFDKS